MSTINALTSGSYYSMKDQATTGETTTQAAATSTLAEILSGVKQAGATTATNSYMLDLSAEAQSYLSGLGNMGATTATSSSKAEDASYVLSREQQATLNSIIAKYKDAPFTQDTFNQIQDDLEDAGISPDILDAKEKVRSFNSTQLFLDAMSGTSSGSNGFLTAADDTSSATKEKNFMKAILDQWEKISTTAGAEED